MWGAYAFADGEDEDFDITNFDYVAADRKFDLTETVRFPGRAQTRSFSGSRPCMERRR